MRARSSYAITVAVVVWTLAAIIGAGAAAAARPEGKREHAWIAASPRPAAVRSSTLHRYVQAVSSQIAAQAGAQSQGYVDCPDDTFAVGGGVLTDGDSLAENLNSSFPVGKTEWTAVVNNASGRDDQFVVYADCVKPFSSYTIVYGSQVDNPAGTQSTATVTCPKGTVPLGGGPNSSASSTAVNTNTSIPTATGWRVDENNADPTAGDTLFAFAVCGKRPPAYTLVTGSPATLGADTDTLADAACPKKTVVLGGGGYSDASATTVDTDSTLPYDKHDWRVYQNSNVNYPSTLTAYAICAKTST